LLDNRQSYAAKAYQLSGIVGYAYFPYLGAAADVYGAGRAGNHAVSGGFYVVGVYF